MELRTSFSGCNTEPDCLTGCELQDFVNNRAANPRIRAVRQGKTGKRTLYRAWTGYLIIHGPLRIGNRNCLTIQPSGSEMTWEPEYLSYNSSNRFSDGSLFHGCLENGSIFRISCEKPCIFTHILNSARFKVLMPKYGRLSPENIRQCTLLGGGSRVWSTLTTGLSIEHLYRPFGSLHR